MRFMKILVMSGTRFFGKNLVENLLEQKHDVSLLTRGQSQDSFGNKVKRLRANRNSEAEISAAVGQENWDIIYDQICYDAPQAQIACNVFYKKTKHYVFTSTFSVYPRPYANFSENVFDPYTYEFEKTVSTTENYGEAKRQAESTFAHFQKKNPDFQLSMIRFPFVLGKDDYTLRLKFHVDHVLEGKAIAFPNIDAKTSFVLAEDAARFLSFLTTKTATGPINVCSHEAVSFRELVNYIEKITGKKAILNSSGDPSPYKSEGDWYGNTTKLRMFEFQPQSVHDWLPELIEYYRTNYKN